MTMNNTQEDAGEVLGGSPCSQFMVRAVHAYHRSERDWIARMAEDLGCGNAEDRPGASRRVRIIRHPGKLWVWAKQRWGAEAFSRLEYDMRVSSASDAITDGKRG